MRTSVKIWAALAIVSALLFCSCRDGKGLVVENLHGGYWMPDEESGTHLLRFDAAGELSLYVFAYHENERQYYASPDRNATGNGPYMVDVENGTLFISPDNWMHVILLTSTDLIVTSGEEKYVFRKYGDSQITVVPRNELNELFSQ